MNTPRPQSIKVPAVPAESTPPDERPWYREPAPWLLMSGPALVIVAGAITMWLAASRPDRLVADDYYKRGLLVERRIARDEAAANLGLVATLTWDASRSWLTLRLSGVSETQAVPNLLLRHVARKELDRRVALSPIGPAVFAAPLDELPAGLWDTVIETEQWRMEGVWLWPQQRELRLGGE